MEKLFTWIWRINGLIFLFAAMLIGGAMLLEFLGSNSGQTTEHTVTNIAADPDGNEQWVLDRANPITGTDYIYLRLVSEKDSITSDEGTLGMISTSYEYERENANSKNVLFINERTGQTRWLFNDLNQLIASIYELPEQYAQRYFTNSSQTKQSEILIYTIFSSDDNNDGIIDSNDNPTLAVSSASGENYQVVIEGYEKILSTKLLDDGTLSITHQTRGAAYFVRYSIEDSKEIEKVELPAVGE